MRRFERLRLHWLTLVVIGAGLIAAACGSSDANTPATGGTRDSWDGRAIAQANDPLPFFMIVINSQRLVLGENRLQLAVQDKEGAFIEHASGELRLFHLGGPSDEPESVGSFPLEERTLDYVASSDDGSTRITPAAGGSTHDVALAPPLPDGRRATNHDGEHATIFTSNVSFDSTGQWGIEVDVEVDGEQYEGVRALIEVQERLAEPMIGDPIPASEQPTVDDVDDVAEIDSSVPPIPELHDITVAEALATGDPLVVAFTTPAFCETRFCGPVMEAVVVPAWEEYGDQVRFIHIEPYDIPMARQGQIQMTATTAEWNLTIEPIIFVVNPDGTVAAKFEGVLEPEELTAALDAVLAAS